MVTLADVPSIFENNYGSQIIEPVGNQNVCQSSGLEIVVKKPRPKWGDAEDGQPSLIAVDKRSDSNTKYIRHCWLITRRPVSDVCQPKPFLEHWINDR